MFCCQCCDQLVVIKVEVSSLSPSGDTTSLICVDMQICQVYTCTHTTDIQWCVCMCVWVCMCSLPLCYLLQYLGHCFCCLCSLSDGYSLYSNPNYLWCYMQFVHVIQALESVTSSAPHIKYFSHYNFYLADFCANRWISFKYGFILELFWL